MLRLVALDQRHQRIGSQSIDPRTDEALGTLLDLHVVPAPAVVGKPDDRRIERFRPSRTVPLASTSRLKSSIASTARGSSRAGDAIGVADDGKPVRWRRQAEGGLDHDRGWGLQRPRWKRQLESTVGRGHVEGVILAEGSERARRPKDDFAPFVVYDADLDVGDVPLRQSEQAAAKGRVLGVQPMEWRSRSDRHHLPAPARSRVATRPAASTSTRASPGPIGSRRTRNGRSIRRMARTRR